MNNTLKGMTQSNSNNKMPSGQEVLAAIQIIQDYLHEDMAEYDRLTPEEQEGHIGQALIMLKALPLSDYPFEMRVQYHRYSSRFPNFLISDGVKQLADQGYWNWLFNKMAKFQSLPTIKNHPKRKENQYWRLVAYENQPAMLVCEYDDNDRIGCEVVYKESISDIDCPYRALEIWVQLTQFDDCPDVPAYVARFPGEY